LGPADLEFQAMWEGRFWADHWWLIIVLAAFAVPIVGTVLSPINEYMRYRRRRDAMEVLKVYAQQGKEPPREVLDAINPGGWGSYRWGPPTGNAATGPDMDGATDRMSRRDERRAERWARRAERWERRQPLARWNGAIFMGALATGFGLASQYAPESSENVFLLVAIITGTLAAAAILSALLATFLKVD
jgi:hypothetical protein